ncbi:MAG: hypothetical protein QOD77_2019 [Thermoplasmata archaeon]|nr:hypothetical protein [Thermoplasmata archaeon]
MRLIDGEASRSPLRRALATVALLVVGLVAFYVAILPSILECDQSNVRGSPAYHACEERLDIAGDMGLAVAFPALTLGLYGIATAMPALAAKRRAAAARRLLAPRLEDARGFYLAGLLDEPMLQDFRATVEPLAQGTSPGLRARRRAAMLLAAGLVAVPLLSFTGFAAWAMAPSLVDCQVHCGAAPMAARAVAFAVAVAAAATDALVLAFAFQAAVAARRQAKALLAAEMDEALALVARVEEEVRARNVARLRASGGRQPYLVSPGSAGA